MKRSIPVLRMKRSVPPWQGAKPQPRMLPTLPSVSERSTPSARQRADSTAWAYSRRSTSSGIGGCAVAGGNIATRPGHRRLSPPS